MFLKIHQFLVIINEYLFSLHNKNEKSFINFILDKNQKYIICCFYNTIFRIGSEYALKLNSQQTDSSPIWFPLVLSTF